MKLNLNKLGRAISALEEVLDYAAQRNPEYDSAEYRALRSGVIQNFEIAYELCWKTMRRAQEEVFPDKPNEVDERSSRDMFKDAFEKGLIDSTDIWLGYKATRNSTSHIYAEKTAEEVYNIIKTFLPDAKKLLIKLDSLNV